MTYTQVNIIRKEEIIMIQIKVSITEEEHTLLQKRANNNLNSVSREARLILRHVLYNEIPTPASSDPTQPQPQPQQQREIAGIEFPSHSNYPTRCSTGCITDGSTCQYHRHQTGYRA